MTSNQVGRKSKIQLLPNLGRSKKSLLRNLRRSEKLNFDTGCVEVKNRYRLHFTSYHTDVYNNVIQNTKILNNFVKRVDLFTNSEYNNSVIAKPQNSNNSVKEYFYGTIDIEQTA